MRIQAGNYKDAESFIKESRFLPITWEWNEIEYLVTLSAGDEAYSVFEAQIDADTLIALAAAVEKQRELFKKDNVSELTRGKEL